MDESLRCTPLRFVLYIGIQPGVKSTTFDGKMEGYLILFSDRRNLIATHESVRIGEDICYQSAEKKEETLFERRVTASFI